MKYSEQPRIELAQTKICIEGMRDAKSLGQFEEQWKSFLHSLDRIWNTTSNHYGKSPKWNGWKRKYENIRKNDPLLTYLAYARGADEHTVNEILSREPEGIGINPAEGNGLYIDQMTIENGQIYIESPQKIRVDFTPTKTKLLPVLNRGRTYAVPVSHRGQVIDPTKVVEMTEIAVRFYEDFLNDVESYFVK
jgi:hypothetical protein